MKFQLAQAVEILTNTPLVLKSLLGNLSNEWTESVGNVGVWKEYLSILK